MSPEEFVRLTATLTSAAGHLATIAVRDVAKLLEILVPEEAVLSAAQASGYLGCRFKKSGQSGTLAGAGRFLGAKTTQRYFDLLRSKLNIGEAPAATRLLEDWAKLWLQRKRYPRGFGKRLRRILQAVPPSIRLCKLRSPLMSVGSCIRLSQHASRSDHGDVLSLYHSVATPVGDPDRSLIESRQSHASSKVATSSTLEIVFAELDKRHLTTLICLPLDAARACFLLESVTAGSHVEVLDVVTSFYIHLLRYTNRTAADLGFEQAGPDAYALLDHSFARDGGATGAIAEARIGTRGGLRYVLDQMTEQFKRDRQEDHIRHVLSTAIDPLDWDAKVDFVRRFLERHPDAVPADFSDEPPERFAGQCGLIARAYVEAMGQVQQVLRAM